jgi:hypothetical protein
MPWVFLMDLVLGSEMGAEFPMELVNLIRSDEENWKQAQFVRPLETGNVKWWELVADNSKK